MVPEAIEAMAAELCRAGNASSLHATGRRARRVVEESRERLAAALSARPSEVIFTSGGTESDNLAVKGLYWARRAAHPHRRRILVSSVEHHAVLDAAYWLADHDGAIVQLLDVDRLGRVEVSGLQEALADPTDVALISVMWANNEVGTLQPIAELAALARAHAIPLHTDAVAAVGQVPVDFSASGVDAMTITGHKLGGPIGSGALLLSRDLACTPLLHGGGQERDVRSGTLDPPGVAALSVAVELAVRDRAGELRDRLVREMADAVPDATLNGDPDPAGRLPGNAHFSFPGCEGDALMMLLDARGIECSTGSACSAGVAQPSHVLLAMGQSAQLARSSLRLSLGHTSTPDCVRSLIEAIGPVVARARRAGVATRPRAARPPPVAARGGCA
ncbi:MAG: cysteine desulfurase family protein, partial [Mycobacteriales bacterium]